MERDPQDISFLLNDAPFLAGHSTITDNVLTAIQDKHTELLRYKANGATKWGYITMVGNTGLITFSCIPSGQYYSSLISAILILALIFVASFIFIIFVMSKEATKIVKPLIELNEAAMQLAEGNLDVTLNVQSDDEVGDLARSIGKTVC